MTARFLVFLLFLVPVAAAETSFEVIHKKKLRPDGRGEIRITGEAIEFHANKEKNSRRWAYVDVQHFDRIAANEFVLLSYEDAALQLGRDRRFRFVITSGELREQELARIAGKIGKPVSNHDFTAPAFSRYEVPVKHLHRLGGCEGTLSFTDSRIFYQTDEKKHAREWFDREGCRLGLVGRALLSRDPRARSRRFASSAFSSNGGWTRISIVS